MILIGLGSNLPFLNFSSQEIVIQAAEAVSSFGEGHRLSPLYSSPAWPDPAKPKYVNAVLRMDESELEPEELLAAIMAVELSFGRRRDYIDNPELRYAPRTIDLDLLAYHQLVFETENAMPLIVPHPRMQDRDFVLLPMADVAADWVHPRLGKSCEELVTDLKMSSHEELTAKPL